MHRRTVKTGSLVARGGFPAGAPFGRRGFIGDRLLLRRIIGCGRIGRCRRVVLRRLCIDLDRTVIAVALARTACALRAVGVVRRADIGFGAVRTVGPTIAVRRRGAVGAMCVVAIAAIAPTALAALTIVLPVPVTLTLSVIGLGIRSLPLVPLLLIDGIDAEVMFGMLIVVLGSYSVAGGRCVARQSQIFFVYLERVAANPDAWSVTIECLLTICAPTPTIPAARALRALALFHISLHIEAGFCFR